MGGVLWLRKCSIRTAQHVLNPVLSNSSLSANLTPCWTRTWEEVMSLRGHKQCCCAEFYRTVRTIAAMIVMSPVFAQGYMLLGHGLRL